MPVKYLFKQSSMLLLEPKHFTTLIVKMYLIYLVKQSDTFITYFVHYAVN